MTTYITIEAQALDFTLNAKARPHTSTVAPLTLYITRVTSTGATRVTSTGAIRVISRETTAYPMVLHAKKRRFVEHAKKVNQ